MLELSECFEGLGINVGHPFLFGLFQVCAQLFNSFQFEFELNLRSV